MERFSVGNLTKKNIWKLQRLIKHNTSILRQQEEIKHTNQQNKKTKNSHYGFCLPLAIF